MPPKRRHSLVVKEESKVNNSVPIKVESTNVSVDESENANKRVRRTRASSGTSSATVTSIASEQTLSTQHADLDLYLQDFFYIICTHKDATTPRLLSVVFYLLPSQKVSLNVLDIYFISIFNSNLLQFTFDMNLNYLF